MGYGDLEANKITYSTPTGDVIIDASGLPKSGVVVTTNSGTFTSLLSGNVITGDTVRAANITGVTGIFTTISNTATVGSATRGNQLSANSGTFVNISGTNTTINSLTGSVLRVATGTAANPTISFQGDSDTGFYADSANSFGASASGQSVAIFGIFPPIAIQSQKQLRFNDSDNSNFVGFVCPAVKDTNITYTLPSGDGASGWLLTRGSPLSWTHPSSGAMSYQEFTSNGTWTKPSGCVFLYVECVGGGGGGGSGPRYALYSGTTFRQGVGGGGGAGGLFTYRYLPASIVGDTVSVTVGAGGAGGGSISVNDTTTGSGGSAGGFSNFGTFLTTTQAQGGSPGISGTSALASGGLTPFYAGSNSLNIWGAGGGTANHTTGAGGQNCPFGPGGGGASWSLSGNTIQDSYSNGGIGFGMLKSTGIAGTGTLGIERGGASGGTFGGTITGNNATSFGDGGGAGGITGGAGVYSGGGRGGNGAFPGGGGGGGGPANNGFNSGAGGNGADGVVRVWAWCSG